CAKFSGVSKRFGKRKVVKNLNLEIKKNEFFALLGPNGCGKTTTLNMLTSRLVPTAGAIHVDGIDVTANKFKAINMMGVCPQFDLLLIPSMSIYDHLYLFLYMNGYTNKEACDYIDTLLESMGILNFKYYKCGQLSGGTKRKVSTIIAIMLPKSLVMLDESSAGLDPLARSKMWKTVRALGQERTTVMTTHYISETSNCDRIGVMTKGTLKSCGTEHEL
ncbi:P-loop containing nucleoside triphosphate hydrolase protein, partial [Rozella allomycis CSF55]